MGRAHPSPHLGSIADKFLFSSHCMSELVGDWPEEGGSVGGARTPRNHLMSSSGCGVGSWGWRARAPHPTPPLRSTARFLEPREPQRQRWLGSRFQGTSWRERQAEEGCVARAHLQKSVDPEIGSEPAYEQLSLPSAVHQRWFSHPISSRTSLPIVFVPLWSGLGVAEQTLNPTIGTNLGRSEWPSGHGS